MATSLLALRLVSARQIGQSDGDESQSAMDTNALDGYANGPAMPFSVSSATLIASLIWGSIGAGYFVYAKKQRSVPAFLGGVGLIGISYFIASPLWMSVASAGIMAGIWYWARNE